jgi:hypothetical protein
MTKEEIREKFLRDHPNFFESTHSYTSEKYKKYRTIYYKNNTHKIVARNRVAYMLRIGKVKRENCKICGLTKSQAHHPDYSKPLEVIWLCSQHHKDLHRGILTLNKVI